MKQLVFAVLAVAAACAAAGVSMAPPARLGLGSDAAGGAPVRGAVHVHSRRSDGAGTVDAIAAAAARAGLTFVVLTDHGDGARHPEPPEYRSGVLCIDAVEISTDGGHVLALGMGRSPYPLGGEARDVVEDVARLGGLSIVAHPDSPKTDLRWFEWAAPFGGLEWLNGDSEWRDESAATLARTLLTYPFRRAESLVAVFDRPESALARWDALTARRAVVGIAGADAHARLGPADHGAGSGPATLLQVPAYEQMFRAMSVSIPEAQMTGDAAADARTILAAIRAGRVFSSIDGLAAPAVLRFTASSGDQHAVMGGVIAAGQPVALDVETNAPAGARIRLIRNGKPLASADGPSLRHVGAGEPAVYRVEVELPRAPGSPPVPWIVSNPIYVRGDARTSVAAPGLLGPPTEFLPLYEDGPAAGAGIERSPRSEGALDTLAAAPAGTQLAFRYALGGTAAESPYAALVLPAGPALSQYDRLMFTGRASAPMRLSVQLRSPGGEAGERWHRSVYLDTTAREIVVPFTEMRPRGAASSPTPALQTVRDLLFVVDTVNTPPGTSGEVRLDVIRLAR